MSIYKAWDLQMCRSLEFQGGVFNHQYVLYSCDSVDWGTMIFLLVTSVFVDGTDNDSHISTSLMRLFSWWHVIRPYLWYRTFCSKSEHLLNFLSSIMFKLTPTFCCNQVPNYNEKTSCFKLSLQVFPFRFNLARSVIAVSHCNVAWQRVISGKRNDDCNRFYIPCLAWHTVSKRLPEKSNFLK